MALAEELVVPAEVVAAVEPEAREEQVVPAPAGDVVEPEAPEELAARVEKAQEEREAPEPAVPAAAVELAPAVAADIRSTIPTIH